MHSHSVVTSGFILFGLLIQVYQTVTSDKTFKKSVTSSPEVSTTPAATKSWPSNGDNKSLALVTQRDIMNAFSVVTNDSNQIKQMISEMYNLRLADPAYVFRLPQGDGGKSRFLIMQRSDFVQPIFPSLSASYVRLMKTKGVTSKDNNRDIEKPKKIDDDWWKRVNPNSVEDDDPTLFLNLQTERNFIKFVSEVNQQGEKRPSMNEDSNNEWSLLGLHGWKGILSKPSKINRPHSNADVKPLIEHSHEKPAQKWDLPGRMQEDSLELSVVLAMRNTSILKALGNFTQESTYPITNMHGEHSDTDVYIARVNDPFGHSTKWDVKNSSSNIQQDDRKKRAVIELYSMIKCSTGCDPIVYKGYGCYCGFLGDGEAVDGIDQCCKLHDKCYSKSNCISYLEYFVPYVWKCYRGKPLCALDHGEWGEPSSCAGRLCKCDMLLSRCLQRFLCPQRRAICRSSKARMLQNLLFNF